MNQTILIAIGQSGADVVKRSPIRVTGGGSVAGLGMYDASVRTGAIGFTVVLGDDYYPITFPSVEHLAFYEQAGEGIDEIALDLQLPPQPASLADTRGWAVYDEAVRKLVQDTIDRINVAGWQRWIRFSKPRLSGRDTIAFVPDYRNRGYSAQWQDSWGIDPSYRITPDDWANLTEDWPTWYWIKHGASIKLRYEKDSRDPEMPIVFESLTVTIKSADTTAGVFYGETKGDWKTYKQSEMTRLLAIRKETEATAKAAGAKILEDYKDYPIGGVRLPDPGQ